MKEQYFHNYGTKFDDEKEFENFLETNIILLENAKPGDNLKMSFDNLGCLSNVTILMSGKDVTNKYFERLNIKDAIGQLKYKELRPNIPYSMKMNEAGISWLGGSPDNVFVIPKNKKFSKFQYFGFINKDEKCFPELEFDIHLTFPLFCSADALVLDYSDSCNPKIYNEMDFWTEEVFNNLNPDFNIEYTKTPISFEQVKGRIFFGGDELGRAGIFFSSIGSGFNRPLSPITKKPMNFLCQIEGGKEVPTKFTDVSPDYKLFDYGFKNLMFYSRNGEITIFYENETRLVLYMIGGS